ncbi:MAG: GGDEF domain-containing protein [Coprococcus sp.]
MLFLLSMKHRDIRKDNYKEKLFDAMIWMTIIECVVETLTFVLDGRIYTGCIAIAYFLNTICFVGTSLISFLWCLYVDLRIFNRLQSVRKKIKYLMIPFLILLIIALVNLSGCGILFIITRDNVYQRGKFVWIIYAVLLFYITYSITLVDRFKKNGLYIHYFPTFYFVTPCILGVMIQAFSYGIALGWISVALALLFVYVQLQSLNALLDALSGLYNRRYLDNLLEHLQRNSKISTVYGIMMDVNSFKKINDNFGHSVGDDALRNIGQILSDSIPDCGIAIRYAGDEFVILLNTESEDTVKETIEQVQHNIEEFNQLGKHKYQLSLSMGYGRFDTKKDDVEKFLFTMDERMYEAKEKYYASLAEK